MSKIQEVRDYINALAISFGAKVGQEHGNSYIERKNIGDDALNDNGAYFGFVEPEESTSGQYHDFSLVIFPDKEDKSYLICLGIGSLGFKNDYELATYPGVRRLFKSLVSENGYCKSDFTDIETSLPKSFTGKPELSHLKSTIIRYTKFLPVCEIVNKPTSEEGKKVIAAFTAAYARLRNWPNNKEHRKAVEIALSAFEKKNVSNQFDEVIELMTDRKFVILQGPPGTGKTRLAKKLADGIRAKVFFTQFHAETSYSDFIYGLRPNTASNTLLYQDAYGIFYNAIQHALNTEDDVVLIIDEINRANLANVLGPVFYLFEHKMEDSDVEIEIAPGLKINKLPNNFYVIGTMNTADRSLAVVDFALRRRFAWYTVSPQPIGGKSSKKETEIDDINSFYNEDYNAIDSIFNWYASSDELSLQPGQGYFIASNDEEMTARIKYEIFPLIKEYLQEGLLRSAKEEFNTYFMNRISLSLVD
ncbi:McrB family protein [Sphingobacterium sp. xlx-130]|uniref:McrB family protein n=1 Tax=Sphingobacterium sp. xlx-130 TaxID=2654323 RepID=UPI0013DD7455|nr:AAA family ATPase [Sphingobacterium sp. xlx-130]